MSMLFISHDLALVGEIADQVVVMRHGIVREQGPVARIFEAPQDDYTRALLACRPGLDGNPARLMVIDDHMAGRAAHASVGKAKDPDAPVLLRGPLAGQELLAARGRVRQARVQGGAATSTSTCARATRSASSASRARARRRWG